MNTELHCVNLLKRNRFSRNIYMYNNLMKNLIQSYTDSFRLSIKLHTYLLQYTLQIHKILKLTYFDNDKL